MRRSPFIEDKHALWLKGNIHSHTTFSDGTLTPEEMKEAYQHHGYDFLAVTDHAYYTDTRTLTDDQFTMLQGFELYANADNGKEIHVNFLWANTLDGIEPGQTIRLPEQTGKASTALSYELREKGCFVMLNHPHWSMLTSPEIEDDNPYHAIEIMNYGTEWLENTGDGSVFWTELLNRGCKLWNGGSDDNHNLYDVDSCIATLLAGSLLSRLLTVRQLPLLKRSRPGASIHPPALRSMTSILKVTKCMSSAHHVNASMSAESISLINARSVDMSLSLSPS